MCTICLKEQGGQLSREPIWDKIKPQESKKMLSISYENGQFIGLPVQWRQSLGLSRGESAREVDIQEWDAIVGGKQGANDNSKL